LADAAADERTDDPIANAKANDRTDE